MNKLWIVGLIIGWGAFLIPTGLKRRSEQGSFSILGLGDGLSFLFSRKSGHGNNGGIVSLNGQGQKWSPASGLGQNPYDARSTSNVEANSARLRTSKNVRRQRLVVSCLAGGAVLTLLLSFIPGLKILLGAHFVIDVLFVFYIVALVRVKHNRKAIPASPFTSQTAPVGSVRQLDDGVSILAEYRDSGSSSASTMDSSMYEQTPWDDFSYAAN